VHDSGGEQVVIESVAAGGDGVGRLADGMTVFVPRTAPGDRVRLGSVRRRRRHARAEAAAIVAAGPDRVTPPCRHYAAQHCGGCQWQHLSLDAQHRAKRRMAGDALRRIGGLAVEDPPLVPSPRALGYRATITFTVRWPRAGTVPVVGFHRATGEGEAAGDVFALERCEIAREEVQRLWDALRPAAGALPRGDDVRLKLRSAADGSLHALVAGGEGAWTSPQPLVAAARAAGLAVTVWWEPSGGTVRRMGGREADPGAVAFAQVNPEVAEALRNAVLAACAGVPGRALDLYAGAGEVAVALATRGWRVAAVEANAAAAARADEAVRRAGLEVEVRADRVERCIGALLPADVVVVNPPRTGLDEAVTRALAQQPPRRLVYVSCDPATLARDLKRLGAAPERLDIVCYDMFPQTSHVESVAVLAGPEGVVHRGAAGSQAGPSGR